MNRTTSCIHTAITVLAVGIGLAAFGATAFADPPPWAHGGWRHHGWYHGDDDDGGYRAYPPPPVYYAPPPPVYYAPPPPVFYAPPALSFGINIPLGGDRDGH